jgi:formamidopyrimidine-DNA glycosylase
VPELPEVETTLRGIEPYLTGHAIHKIIISQPKLRWPVPPEITQLEGARILKLQRRAKYLLVSTDRGHMIWHLGMSGSMRILPRQMPQNAHEHVIIWLDDDNSLRFRDPRRFGALLLTHEDPMQHKLLSSLGPEPLSDAFNAGYLYQNCRKRKTAIKNLIMDSHIVVGVGNIYACESLFSAGINPCTSCSRLSKQRIQRLVDAIKAILQRAINQGGTTLQDFTQADGKPGYFAQSLQVYGRENQACIHCSRPLKRITQGQRSTFYCTQCQK